MSPIHRSATSAAHDAGHLVRALALALALLPPASAAAQTQSADGRRAEAARPTVAASLRPGDKIRVTIWREPDLSGEFLVKEHGDAVLPKLGPVLVTDRDPEQLVADIEAAYARYIAHTSIAVVPLRRIQILGAVRTPGFYHADPTMTLGDVLALAGGTTAAGKTDRLVLIRGGKRQPLKIEPQTLVTDSPIRSGDQIYVPERSWISRNPGVFAALVSTAVSLTVTIIRLR